MNPDNEPRRHYPQLMSIGTPWEVKQVEIELGWQWGRWPRRRAAVRVPLR